MFNGDAQPEALPEHGLEVFQLLRGLVRDGLVVIVVVPVHLALGDGVADLALQARVGARGRGEMHDGAGECDGGGLGAGEDLEVGFALDLALRESVADEASLPG